MPLMGTFSSTGNLEKKIDDLTNKIKSNESANPRDKIIQTEEKLKDLIDKILTKSKGTNWDKDPNLAFGRQKREEIEKRIADKREKFPTQQFSDRLLDHATMLDLKLIVEKNKDEEELNKLFPSITRGIELLGILGEHRNLILHHEKEIKDFQKYLVLGISGHFDDLIANYQTGISKKVTQWGFEIYLKEDEIIGIEQAKQKVIEIAQKIGSIIANKTVPQENITVGSDQQYIFTIKNSKVDVGFSNFTRESGDTELQFFQRMNVSIQTKDYELLKQLAKDIGMKYWFAKWILPSNAMDTLHIIQSIKNLTGRSGSGITVHQGNIRLHETIESTILDTASLKIWATLGGGADIPTTIQLRFIDGNNRFVNVFDNFNPDLILKILYGEMSPNQIQEIATKACSES